MIRRPWFVDETPPPDATDDMNDSTSGFRATIAATAFWCSTIASNEVPCAASVVATIRPWSSLGMNPFGTSRKRTTVPMRTPSENDHRRPSVIHDPPERPPVEAERRADTRLRSPDTRARASSRSRGRRKRLQSMGVSVSETKPETRMAALIVTANSWNSRPRSPPMRSTGMNTATRDRVIERIVKPISREPSSAARSGGLPCSMCRWMFSSITIASSTTKPTERVSAMSDKLSRL